MLNRRVPVNKVGSCGMMVIFYLSFSSGISLIFTPSISIFPDSISIILVRAKLIVLLPAPVRPTTPIFYPPSTLKLSCLNTKSTFGRYLNSTSLNDMAPFIGHFFSKNSAKFSTGSFNVLSWFSWGISSILKHLWALTIWVSNDPNWKRPAIR